MRKDTVIDLSKGQKAVISSIDLPRVRELKWSFGTGGYACAMLPNRKNIRLHRFILDAKPKEIVDHINGDRLDNRRENLRICTPSQQACNQAAYGFSHYKGVSWCKRLKRWEVQICVLGKRKGLGTYADEKEAAKAYDKAARELHGEFSRLNFPT